MQPTRRPPARDKVQPLVLAAPLEVAYDVASQVQHDAAQIGDGQDGHLDVAEVVHARCVVRLVEVAVLGVVDCLIAVGRHELLGSQRTFEAFGACDAEG